MTYVTPSDNEEGKCRRLLPVAHDVAQFRPQPRNWRCVRRDHHRAAVRVAGRGNETERGRACPAVRHPFRRSSQRHRNHLLAPHLADPDTRRHRPCGGRDVLCPPCQETTAGRCDRSQRALWRPPVVSRQHADLDANPPFQWLRRIGRAGGWLYPDLRSIRFAYRPAPGRAPQRHAAAGSLWRSRRDQRRVFGATCRRLLCVRGHPWCVYFRGPGAGDCERRNLMARCATLDQSGIPDGARLPLSGFSGDDRSDSPDRRHLRVRQHRPDAGCRVFRALLSAPEVLRWHPAARPRRHAARMPCAAHAHGARRPATAQCKSCW